MGCCSSCDSGGPCQGEPHCHGPDCPVPEAAPAPPPACKPCGNGKAAAILGMLRDRTYAAQVRGLGGRANVGLLLDESQAGLRQRQGFLPIGAWQMEIPPSQPFTKAWAMPVGRRLMAGFACEGHDMRSGAPVSVGSNAILTVATIPLDVRRFLAQTKGRLIFATGFADLGPDGRDIASVHYLVKRTPLDHPFWISSQCFEVPTPPPLTTAIPQTSQALVAGVRRAEIVHRPGVGLVVKNFAG